MSDRTTTGQPTDAVPVSDRSPSEGRQAVKQAGRQADNNTTSSRSDAQTSARAIEEATTMRVRGINAADALTRVIANLRPDWAEIVIRRAILNDDRDWQTIVLAYVNGAADPDTRHPNGLRHRNAASTGAPTPTPMSWEELNKRPRCEHGALAEPPCALCRAGVDA